MKMKTLAIALASLASVAVASAVGIAQTATRAPTPVSSGTVTRSPGAAVEQWVVGYPCDVVVMGDVTEVFLKTQSYCGGTQAGYFVLQRQYGSGINTAQPAITYDLYPSLIEQMINNSWRKVGAHVTSTGSYARSVSFKAQ